MKLQATFQSQNRLQRKLRLLIIALFLSGLGGVALALFTDALEDYVTGTRDLEVDLGLKVLGLVPHTDVGAREELALAGREDIMVICHGGPISEPEDARFVLERTRGIVGFYGASSMERLPTEVAITGRVEAFQRLRVNRGV